MILFLMILNNHNIQHLIKYEQNHLNVLMIILIDYQLIFQYVLILLNLNYLIQIDFVHYLMLINLINIQQIEQYYHNILNY